MKFQVDEVQEKVLGLFRENNLGSTVFNTEINVVAQKIEDENSYLSMVLTEDSLTINYSQDVLFYRGLFTLYPRMIESGNQKLIEKTTIHEVAVSLDFSRNAIMKVDSLKEYLLYLAAVGVNTVYLYTEDTYEVEGEEYFGYLRGRYSVSEIKEIVRFSEELGIEIVPAIQTLAHLTQFLRWPTMSEMREDANTLLIDEERSYLAIERMIHSCKSMYKSKRIHLGMDEAYQAGLVRYLDIHGYVPRVELILRHLKKVLKIVENAEMEPLIWSDFIYKVLDKTKTSRLYYPDAEMDLDYIEKYPKNVTYVHWDYGCEDISQYKKVIRNHLEFCDTDNYMLATGAHIFGKIAPNHGKSINTMVAGITACKELGLKRTMLTTWGDDGQEIEHMHALVSAYYYSESIYNEGVISEEVKRSMNSLLGQGTYEFLYHLTYFDEVFGMLKDNPMMGNISKSILWQDPLLGIYDAHIALYEDKFNHTLGSYYEELTLYLESIKLENNGILQKIRERYISLAQILSLKSELGLELQQARQIDDTQSLLEIEENKIKPLIKLYTQIQDLHEEIWNYYYKPNGWEVLERRYAGSCSRLKTVRKKIKGYAEEQKGLEELLERKLLFCNVDHPVDFSGFSYSDTASSGYN